MRTFARVFWAPKDGSSEAEYQDAFAPEVNPDEPIEGAVQRFAVSDGASEAIYSGPWARLLARGWLECSLEVKDGDLLGVDELGREWARAFPAVDLPWWAEQKVQSGSFAALAGLELSAAAPQWTWRFVALGDSCGFFIRDEKIFSLGPVKASDGFSSSPYLLSTNQSAQPDTKACLHQECGELVSGDQFILVTDALALLATERIEAGEQQIEAIFPFLEATGDPQRAFGAWVQENRDARLLRNDDVTLLQVAIHTADV